MEHVEYKDIDPFELEIDPVNERKTGVEPGKEFVEDVSRRGVVSPIVVRKKNNQNLVVSGQRRTLAAQEANLDDIPARIMEMDDTEARVASIRENEDGKSVPLQDRAQSVKTLKEENDWSQKRVAEELGYSQGAVSRWLEPTHKGWENTAIDPSEDDDLTNQVSARALRKIRQNTTSKDERERVAKVVAEENIKLDLITRAAESNKEFKRALALFAAQQKEDVTVIDTNIRITGSTAESVKEAAKDMGASESSTLEHLIKQGLKQKGFSADTS